MMKYYSTLTLASMILIVFYIRITEGQEIKPNHCSDYYGKLYPEKAMCLLPAKESIRNCFSSYLVMFNCSKCEIVVGKSSKEVENVQSLKNRIFSGLLSLVSNSDLGTKRSGISVRLPPNVNWYIGVKGHAKEERLAITTKIGLDPTCAACLIIGTLLFFSASRLSTSVKFYYTSGIGVGILASVLILVFILSRFVPKKPAAYTILIGGWSFGAWLIRYIWSNLHKVLTEYYMHVIAYVSISGFLSFAFCYWRGPVSNPKTQNIIQWSIQLFALFLLYSSSQFQVVSVAVVASVTIGNLLFIKRDLGIFSPLLLFFKTYIWGSKPEPPKFLTEEEYRIQGEIETRKALEELREYCNSPKCSPWKTLSRIKSPSKFIYFMERESHVSDAEMTLHDEELPESDDENDLISEDETESDTLHMHKGDNGTTRSKTFSMDPNISEDED